MDKDSSSSCASSYTNHVCTKVIRVFLLPLLDLSRFLSLSLKEEEEEQQKEELEVEECFLFLFDFFFFPLEREGERL